MTALDQAHLGRRHVQAPPLRYAVALDPPRLARALFGDAEQLLSHPRLERVGGLLTDLASHRSREVLAHVDALVTGWGCPPLTREVLQGAVKLRTVVHAGGGIAELLPERVDRELQVSTAATANAIPVAEYTVAMVILAGKDAFRAERVYRDRRGYVDREVELAAAGNYGRVVGVVGASRIGRLVLGLLRALDVRVLLSDPFINAAQAQKLGAELCDLDELLRRSDIVTLHAPVTPDTIGLVSTARLALMRDGATLINTARGEIVDQDALIAEVRAGRLRAVLDVTSPDPLEPTSELFELPGVVLTPHIAGALGNELERLGRHAADELIRVADGLPLLFGEPPPWLSEPSSRAAGQEQSVQAG